MWKTFTLLFLAHPFLYFIEDCTPLLIKVSKNFAASLRELGQVLLSHTIWNGAKMPKLLLKSYFPDDLPNGTLCCHWWIAPSKPAWLSRGKFPKYRAETATTTQPSYSRTLGWWVSRARQGFTVRALEKSCRNSDWNYFFLVSRGKQLLITEGFVNKPTYCPCGWHINY